MAGLGTFNTDSSIVLTTSLNTIVTGKTDVLIDIYNAGGDKVVDNGVMTELGTTGIYRYGYRIPKKTGTYTAVITCVSQRNYDELQTFQAELPNGAGGMVAQYPANVINKKELAFREDMKKLLLALTTKVELIANKEVNVDLKGVNNIISESLKDLFDVFDTTKKSQEEKMAESLTQFINNGKATEERFVQEVADFTDKIYQLEENTKLLPNSLNSLLIDANKQMTSKFSQLDKQINQVNKKMSEFNDKTSKFSKEERLDLKETKKELKEQISKLQTEVQEANKSIPMFISDKFKTVYDSVDEKYSYHNASMDNLKDVMKESHRMQKEREGDHKKQIKDEIEQVNKSLECLKENSPTIESWIDNNNNIENKIKDVGKSVESTKSSTDKQFKELKLKIPKLTHKKDLAVLSEQMNDTIKEFQSNNTKKIKVLRDKLDEVEKNNKESSKINLKKMEDMNIDINKRMEDNDINSQLSLLNSGEDVDD